MMQMLAAGGMPLLADSQRAPDEDNPRGYFEWERIKRLSQQPDCLAEAEGKAVKITSPLLWALPHKRLLNCCDRVHRGCGAGGFACLHRPRACATRCQRR